MPSLSHYFGDRWSPCVVWKSPPTSHFAWLTKSPSHLAKHTQHPWYILLVPAFPILCPFPVMVDQGSLVVVQDIPKFGKPFRLIQYLLQILFSISVFFIICGFPKMGVPPNHPLLDGIFHYKPSILGTPIFRKPPYPTVDQGIPSDITTGLPMDPAQPLLAGVASTSAPPSLVSSGAWTDVLQRRWHHLAPVIRKNRKRTAEGSWNQDVLLQFCVCVNST